MIRVGIIGGAGYTAGELLRLLLQHPEVEIAFVHSASQAGRPVWEVHPDLQGETDLRFSEDIGWAEVLFLCQGHGRSHSFLAAHPPPPGQKVIDLSADHRWAEGFVYGLPEAFRGRIVRSERIANPGCFATAIQLALLPLAVEGWLPAEVHVTAVTGSTGAGQNPQPTTHFSWRANNLSVYKPFTHQHLGEIGRTLETVGGPSPRIHFIPIRGDFPRGILATLTLPLPAPFEKVKRSYENFCAGEPFVHLSERNPTLKQAVNTNKC
ncbi:MAG: N-acetyl-gamma-glutamyl-phosphate reductase, partial [Bacteroidetes bacterium]